MYLYFSIAHRLSNVKSIYFFCVIRSHFNHVEMSSSSSRSYFHGKHNASFSKRFEIRVKQLSFLIIFLIS